MARKIIHFNFKDFAMTKLTQGVAIHIIIWPDQFCSSIYLEIEAPNLVKLPMGVKI